ncbi:MAG: hybrid sensor histidine kinase/response regulator [Deltaproteobacteria bacterium HGW-Deltaproteobacteria-6]|jgi:two-component system NtrC family sensor kinase|nr:MAG: hybrid sensor histidine kinase/response regulator [Deltaproteobacteria bacterium HGW-Deltaproteobacteria-6]
MKNILIVDDIAENRYVLEKMLEAQQLKVTSAENGKAALDAAYADPPDLVISDILMPVMDGYALCKTWKADERLKHIPFIFYTATYTGPRDEAFAIKLGADRFIIKPQEPKVFVELLKEFITEEFNHPSENKQPLGSEMEYFRQYNAILFNKLEKKVAELEQVNQRLNQEIDERKRAEEKLLSLTQAVEEGPAAIILTDLNGVIEYVNPKFLQVSGYSDQELMGKNVSFLKTPETHFDVYNDMWAAIKSDNVWRGELCNKRKDGEMFWVHLTMSPLKNADGVITKFMAIMEDTTERRQLEAQLRQSQKLEGIGQLAGGVAHDFNNILTAIIGYAYLAYLNMQKDDPLKEHIKHILDYSEKAATITKSLLAFSRQQTTHPAHFNLNDLVSNFQKLLRHLLRENIEIQTKCADGILSVLVDQVQIEQVIMNLATNARDAMPQGGSFIITTSQVELHDEFIKTHGYGKAGSYAEITVADTGIGMDQETQEKIFDPFFTTKEQGKGTGLGMAIVYGIVKKHNGFITVDSELGKGTRYKILLPIVRAAEPTEKKKTEGMAVPRGTETILIAEDDAGIRDLVTTILTDHGYEVIGSADGEEAIDRFSENKEKVALVMLDGIMPKKNGKEAYIEIKALNPEVKVIFMSGYSENMIDLEATKFKDVHFLQKPVLPSNILKKVREVLDN